jgi:uncharacterized Fe-S cluster-containing MiaB family protein
VNKNNRKKILNELTKQAELQKFAVDKLVDDINDANISDSKEYADKIFDMLLNNIDLDWLDDVIE